MCLRRKLWQAGVMSVSPPRRDLVSGSGAEAPDLLRRPLSSKENSKEKTKEKSQKPPKILNFGAVKNDERPPHTARVRRQSRMALVVTRNNRLSLRIRTPPPSCAVCGDASDYDKNTGLCRECLIDEMSESCFLCGVLYLPSSKTWHKHGFCCSSCFLTGQRK